MVVDVQRGTDDGRIEIDRRLTRDEHRNVTSIGTQRRLVVGIEQEIGVEDVLRRRLRVAAGPLAAEELVSGLGLMPSAAVPEVRDVSGELAVVALLGIAGA